MRSRVLLVALAVVMINLPFVHSAWQDHRIDQDGVDVSAAVSDYDQDGGKQYVTFEVPESGDQPGFDGTVRMEPADERVFAYAGRD